MDGIELNIVRKPAKKRPVEVPKKLVDEKPQKNIERKEKEVEPLVVNEEVQNDSSLEKKPRREYKPFDMNPVIDEGDVKISSGEALFSQDSFDILHFHSHLLKNIKEKLGHSKMTVVQKHGIPAVTNGGDVMVKSQTGSGKTLVYAVPIVNKLGTAEPPISRTDGVRCLVILPTRELAVQSYDVFHKLCQSFIRITPGCLSGGEKRKSEKSRIRKGINILVSTPGRLIDHLKMSKCLSESLSKLEYLVIDEADRLLEAGFENQIGEILFQLSKAGGVDEHNERKWQTILLSATLSPAVERLVSISLKNPKYIDVQQICCGENPSKSESTESIMAVPEKLQQYYIVSPTKFKLAALITFLLKKHKEKVVIFAPTQDVVEFLFSLFENEFHKIAQKILSLTVDTKLFRLHGEMQQSERSHVFRSFSQSPSGFLFSTDVAARGLDLPLITWVVQFQAPETPAVYVHRIGRTARAGHSGASILMLLPNEGSYAKLMREKYGMNMKSIKFSSVTCSLTGKSSTGNKQQDLQLVYEIQNSLDQTVVADEKLHEMARKAYVSFIRSYASYRDDMREIFNMKNGLHLGHIARSFCLKDEKPGSINDILRRAPTHVKSRRVQNDNGESSVANSSSYPSWKSNSYEKHESGYKLSESSNFGGMAKKTTKVLSGVRVGKNYNKVAMVSCSEFDSGL